tara:strand:- start:65 stop:703 length:639 start_codon:yes stop_codon:yes gene_type:complete
MTDPWNETSRQLARDAGDAYDKANRERADRIPASAVRIAAAAERQAAALEGLLALLTARLPAAAPAPADFDGAQYAFDAMMGNPLAALGNLTAKPKAADPGDEDDDSDDGRPRIRWSKYDLRCRELARLRTDAKHRAKAAKTPEQRAAAIVERDQAKSEANKRQAVLRRLFYRDDVIDFVKGELVVLFDNVGQCKWRSEYLQAPDYILTFTK